MSSLTTEYTLPVTAKLIQTPPVTLFVCISVYRNVFNVVYETGSVLLIQLLQLIL